MRLKLITFSNNLCTIGKLYTESGEELCCTMEKAWRDNQRRISCVPQGLYKLNPTHSPKFGDTYCLENIALDVSLSGPTKRTHILIHKANKESQLLGCIAPVSRFGILDNEWAGLSSGTAYNQLMALLAGGEHELEIIRN